MFLGEMGMVGYTKNLNIGKYSFGQIKLRPFGKGMGMIVTSLGTINKELLIVKKVNDGKAFELHTDFEDKIEYYQNIRNAWLTMEILFTEALLMNLGQVGVSDFIYAVFVLVGGTSYLNI